MSAVASVSESMADMYYVVYALLGGERLPKKRIMGWRPCQSARVACILFTSLCSVQLGRAMAQVCVDIAVLVSAEVLGSNVTVM